jgi:hypothetical protein
MSVSLNLASRGYFPIYNAKSCDSVGISVLIQHPQRWITVVPSTYILYYLGVHPKPHPKLQDFQLSSSGHSVQ